MRRKIVDLHKSGSTLGAPEGIKFNCRNNITTQPSYCSKRRRIPSPKVENALAQKVQINPRTTAKDFVKMLEETGKLYLYPQ